MVMAVNQIHLRYVKPGQKAEVVLKLLPGKVVNARVQ